MAPHPSSLPTKAALRAELRARLAAIPAETQRLCSLAVCDRLQRHISTCRAVLAFLPIAGEPDIRPVLESLLESGVRLAFPRLDWPSRSMAAAVVEKLSDLVEGPRGIHEPPPSAAILGPGTLDAILVPGLAFDLHLNRLGRGQGFYDRLLAQSLPGDPAKTPPASPRPLLIGVAFEAQIVQDVPTDAWDIPLHRIATESRWIEPGAEV